jgi:hypothetical protein
VRIRSKKLQNKIIIWPDSLAIDYIHQPIDNKLDQIYFYNITRCYKKGYNAFQKVHVNDEEENTYIQGGVKKYKFKETHPGHKFSHLIQLKFPSIPRIALSKGMLCPLNELDLKCTNPPQHVIGECEMYAKIALLMLHPFQQLMTSNTMRVIGKCSIMKLKNTSTKKTQYSGRKGLKYFKIYKTDQH